MARKFAGVLAFAYARPTGGLTHPAIVPHVEAIVDAVAGGITPGPTPIPPGPGPAPAPTPPFVPPTPAALKGPPPTPPAKPRAYPHVNEIKDPAVAKSIRLLWDQHYGLRDQATTIQSTQAAQTTAIRTVTTTVAQVKAIAQQPQVSATTLGPTGETVTAAGPTGGAPAPGTPGGPGGPGGGSGPGGGGSGKDDGGQGNLGCSNAGPTGHVTTGAPLTPETMGRICCGTFNEFSGLGAIVVDQPTRDANRLELLGRMIWHLALAGFPADYYPNNPFTLLIQAGGFVWAYRVTDYATFDVQMFSTMVPGGNEPGTIGSPSGGIAD